MKRTTLLGILMVAVLACTAALSTPKPAHAILCCVTGYSTSQYWASAPTCSGAQTAYRNLVRQETIDNCGGSSTAVCALSIPPCEDWSAMDPVNPWKIDGIATHGCREDCGPLTP